MSDFNLEDEFGKLLDLIETNISELNTDSIQHFGVKGMKWGVRKDRQSKEREPLKSLGPDSVSRKTASGETITLRKIQPTKLHELLGRMSSKYREEYKNGAILDILDGSGKKVGDAIVEKKSNDELYLNWLGIDKSARGKGYATAVMKAGRDFGKQEGFKRMTLEVPGNSPDARHIYEKLGFKVVKEGNSKDDPLWGGLTDMEYEFDSAKHSDELAHYGVKGMKWGTHKKQPLPMHRKYSVSKQIADRETFGQRGVNRINKRMHKGQSYKKALTMEFVHNTAKAVVGSGALTAAAILANNGGLLSQHIATKAHTNRGRAQAAAAMGLPRHATQGPTYSKQNRRGVYNISSM